MGKLRNISLFLLFFYLMSIIHGAFHHHHSETDKEHTHHHSISKSKDNAHNNPALKHTHHTHSGDTKHHAFATQNQFIHFIVDLFLNDLHHKDQKNQEETTVDYKTHWSLSLLKHIVNEQISFKLIKSLDPYVVIPKTIPKQDYKTVLLWTYLRRGPPLNSI